jgi:hypothetical protein
MSRSCSPNAASRSITSRCTAGRFTPLLADAARFARHSPGDRWFVDEIYVKVNGVWRYVYRAIDQYGQVIDVLVSTRRDATAARRFFVRALGTLKVIPREVITDAAPALGVSGFGVWFSGSCPATRVVRFGDARWRALRDSLGRSMESGSADACQLLNGRRLTALPVAETRSCLPTHSSTRIRIPTMKIGTLPE